MLAVKDAVSDLAIALEVSLSLVKLTVVPIALVIPIVDVYGRPSHKINEKAVEACMK
jgi:hypothetical protein